jgi:hypothetical protein
MYRYGEIRVEEYFEDVLDKEGKAYFRRTFTLDAPSAQAKFYFRAATAGRIERREEDGERDVSEGKRTTFAANRLTVTILGRREAVVRDGDPQELLVPLELPRGESTLVLEYRW